MQETHLYRRVLVGGRCSCSWSLGLRCCPPWAERSQRAAQRCPRESPWSRGKRGQIGPLNKKLQCRQFDLISYSRRTEMFLLSSDCDLTLVGQSRVVFTRSHPLPDRKTLSCSRGQKPKLESNSTGDRTCKAEWGGGGWGWGGYGSMSVQVLPHQSTSPR